MNAKERGLVGCNGKEEDNTAWFYLTEEGRELAQKSLAVLDMLTEAKLKGFSDEETAQLLSYFERIRQNLAELQETL